MRPCVGPTVIVQQHKHDMRLLAILPFRGDQLHFNNTTIYIKKKWLIVCILVQKKYLPFPSRRTHHYGRAHTPFGSHRKKIQQQPPELQAEPQGCWSEERRRARALIGRRKPRPPQRASEPLAGKDIEYGERGTLLLKARKLLEFDRRIKVIFASVL